MFGLAAVLFFSVTGITLNHPDWFGEPERRLTAEGRMPAEWLRSNPSNSQSSNSSSDASGEESDPSSQVAKLEIVEHLRKIHSVRGAVAEFRADERECTVTFKGPGYAADAFIDRETGHYDLTQTIHGWIAVINDLHKGRDTGPAWSAVIDISAIVLIVISFSGLVLLLYLKRKRLPGLFVIVGGTIAVIAVIWLLVP